MTRRVERVWEFRCSLLWWHDGPIIEGVDPAVLPLSRSTIPRLEAWAGMLDATLGADKPLSNMKRSSE
jgi:hypothetical protein